jgi:TIR domain
MSAVSIFISHRAEYGRVARELKETIQNTSQGRIEVFISEDIPRGEQWRRSIEEHLRSAESLILIYGAPYEDWAWCFYETGYFAAVDPKASARRIYCVMRPEVQAPGPLNELQMVTDTEQLIKELIDVYRRNSIEFDALALRSAVVRLENGLFGKLAEFEGFPRVYFRVQDADFGSKAEIPGRAVLSGEDSVLGDLFTINSSSVPWADIVAVSNTTAGDQTFMSKWIDETTKIILAARKNQIVSPQTVLIGRGGRRFRTLLDRARIEGDGTFCCEFLAIDEVGGPTVGLSSQQLTLLTSIRMGFRLRGELIQRFPNDFHALSEEDRLARIQEIPRIIENLTIESKTRGDIDLDDFFAAFDAPESERMQELVSDCWFVKEEMYRSLGLSADGKTVLGHGLLGPDVERFRTAFDALRLLNIEFLARCCARVSKMMMISDQKLSDNAKLLEKFVETLATLKLKPAA